MSVNNLIFMGFFIIFSAQVFTVLAEDPDIEGAESMKVMKPLLDTDRNLSPLSEVEPGPLLSEAPDYLSILQKTLIEDKIPGLQGSGYLSSMLVGDIIAARFAQKIGFSPSDANNKEKSWMETIEEVLKKVAIYQEPYGYGTFYMPN